MGYPALGSNGVIGDIFEATGLRSATGGLWAARRLFSLFFCLGRLCLNIYFDKYFIPPDLAGLLFTCSNLDV